MPSHYVAFWNVENLFDTEDSPDRPEWLQKTLAKELKGWTSEILNRKIEQLAFIVCRMNGGKGAGSAWIVRSGKQVGAGKAGTEPCFARAPL